MRTAKTISELEATLAKIGGWLNSTRRIFVERRAGVPLAETTLQNHVTNLATVGDWIENELEFLNGLPPRLKEKDMGLIADTINPLLGEIAALKSQVVAEQNVNAPDAADQTAIAAAQAETASFSASNAATPVAGSNAAAPIADTNAATPATPAAAN